MKTILHLISLLTVSGYAAAQLFGTLGFHVPAIVTASNAVTVLTFAGIALMVLADYGQAPKRSKVHARETTTDTICGRVAVQRPRRLGYSIRRGAEAARLASPSSVIRFPAAPRVRCDRAA